MKNSIGKPDEGKLQVRFDEGVTDSLRNLLSFSMFNSRLSGPTLRGNCKHTQSMSEIKLYKKPQKAIKILLIAICAVAIGFFIINREPTDSFIYFVGWFNILFFGLGIAAGIFHMVDKRPQIRISEEGIWDRTTKQELINWHQIKHAYPLEIFKQKFISLDLDDSFKMKKKPYKLASGINKFVGAKNLNLQVSQLKIDEVTLTNFINEIIATDKENRKAVIDKYF